MAIHSNSLYLKFSMSSLKIALYQFNSTVGDIVTNTQKLIQAVTQAKSHGANLFLAPELAICGYPPEDLLFRPAFYDECTKSLDLFLAIDDITMLIGAPDINGNECYNCVYAIRDGNIIGKYAKMLLPNYGVFDECRYFTPGCAPLVIDCDGINVGVVICEDMWDVEPIAASVESGAEIICIPNASPFERGKLAMRQKVAMHRVEENSVPLVYLNQIGGQDELVFDGGSFAINADMSIAVQLPLFTEELALITYNSLTKSFITNEIYSINTITQEEMVYKALVLALQDYVRKNNFTKVLISFSGGIDSALCLAIAVDALGADNVRSVMMPSPYTADISLVDSRQMVADLGVQYEEIGITPLMQEFDSALSNVFHGKQVDTTEENIQARIRGNIIMAISNKFGYLVVTTGNKSEMTTGYATLYGDMAGGFALLKDVDKTLVYKLAHWRNSLGDSVIPTRIINRAPSAELRANQLDQDSLPDYAVLDQIVELLVEENLSSVDIIARGFAREDVERVARLLKMNEYKRRQSAVGPKITSRAYSKDWRYPISHKFKF